MAMNISYDRNTINQATTKMNENVTLIERKLQELDAQMGELITNYNSVAAQGCINKYNEVKPELAKLPRAIGSVSETITRITNAQFNLQEEMAAQWK